MEAVQTSINCRIRLNRLTRTRQLQQLRRPPVLSTAIDEMQIALTRRRRSDLDPPSDPVTVAIESTSELLRRAIGKSPLTLAATTRRHARAVITSPRMTQAAATAQCIRMAARLPVRERSLIQQGNQRLDRDSGNRIVALSLRTRVIDARQPQLTADQRLWPKCDRCQQLALVHPKVNVLDRSVEHFQPHAPD